MGFESESDVGSGTHITNDVLYEVNEQWGPCFDVKKDTCHVSQGNNHCQQVGYQLNANSNFIKCHIVVEIQPDKCNIEENGEQFDIVEVEITEEEDHMHSNQDLMSLSQL